MIGKVESIYSPFHQGEQRMVPKIGDDVRAMARNPSSFEDHIQTALKQEGSMGGNTGGSDKQSSNIDPSTLPNASNVPLNNMYMAAQRARPYPTTNYHKANTGYPFA